MPAYSIKKPLTVEQKNALGGYSDILAHLMFHRGIVDSGAAGKFITPDYDRDSHDPFLLKDAEKAADRFIQAIRDKELIAIYADYDADGIPGAALMKDFFGRIGYSNFIVYIPHRHDEGFGLNEKAVEELSSQGAKLLITIDCGISDVIPARLAAKLGIDVIITDHHQPPAELPPAYAILDHQQLDCAYPDKHICGSGMAYKFIQAVLKKERFGMKDGMEKWLLDLVGIATLSDMVSLTGENRVFAHYGLAVLRKTPRKGIVRLLSKLRIDQRHLTEDDISFMVTPRINAASRMGLPMDAFDLLTAENDEQASACADHLDEINNERKVLVATLVKQVKKTVRERYGSSIPSAIVLGNPDWRPSLLGLAANSCAEEFDRPVFLWGRDGSKILKGSCRSEGRTNVVEAMRAAPPETFLQYGGHKHSGGFAVGNDEVHYLEQRLNDAIKEIRNSKSEIRGKSEIRNQKSMGMSGSLIDIDESAPEAEPDFVDALLSMDEVNYRLHDDLNKLAPFGVGNPKPLFLFKDVSPESVRKFGKGNDHVELVFKNSNGQKIPAISFFGATEKWADEVKEKWPIDLVASVEKSMFRGRPELRLRIVDVVVK